MKWKHRQPAPSPPAERPPRPMTEGRHLNPNGDGVRQASTEPDIAKRQALFEVETPRRRLEDLVIPASTRTQLQSLLTKIRYRHLLYEEWGLREIDPSGGRTTLNLYGPPGTGKTFAAEAIAHALGMGIIRANYADIESKYVGETPKNIKAAFQKARAANALLFFDEADSILGKRLTAVNQSTDHAVNVSRSVMLLELDSFDGVTVFATNLASNYDPAFVRRILGHIEMPLPDAHLRAQLWRLHIPPHLPVQLAADDWACLVEASAGMAGGDILNSVVLAAATALERDGPTCQIGRGDLLAAIEATVQAKRVYQQG